MIDPAHIMVLGNFYRPIPDDRAIFRDYFKIVPFMNETQFQEDFRMSKRKFMHLHEKLITTSVFNNIQKTAVNSEKCLLIGLWILATPDSYRSVARRFAVSKSTVYECIQRVIQGLLEGVCKNAIKLPNNEGEREEKARGFERISGMPNVIGAIDGCHIQIKAPKGDNKIVYFDRKKNYSIVLQGLCDANMMFIDVDVRWPGSVHDARAFHTSDLYDVGPQVFPNPYYVIGDSAYPLLPWVMTPYKRTRQLDQKENKFNTILSKTRQVIERTFGLLKNRFRRLYYLHRMHVPDYARTIMASCILHNICLASDEYARILIFGRDEENVGVDDMNVENVHVTAEMKRRNLVDYMWEHIHM